jgi:hypothetical protein
MSRHSVQLQPDVRLKADATAVPGRPAEAGRYFCSMSTAPVDMGWTLRW